MGLSPRDRNAPSVDVDVSEFVDAADVSFAVCSSFRVLPGTPKYELSVVEDVKTAEGNESGEFLLQGHERYLPVWCVLSQHDLALYVFRSEEAQEPMRVVELRSISHTGVPPAEPDHVPSPRILLGLNNKQLVMCCKGWDDLQKWLDSHTEQIEKAR